jgi:hypothetical protein
MTVITVYIYSESTCSLHVFHRGHVTVKRMIACSVSFVLPYMNLMFDMQSMCLESGFKFLVTKEKELIVYKAVFIYCVFCLYGGVN